MSGRRSELLTHSLQCSVRADPFVLSSGISHVLESLAFKGTQNRTPFRVTREVRSYVKKESSGVAKA